MSARLTEPLRHRPFRWLAGGRAAAEFGNAIAPVALAFAVLDLTGSAVDLGIVVGARSLANVLLVLFGGVLADRLPRSVILQGTEAAAALSQALLAASVLCGYATLPLLIGLSVLNGAAAAISLPASSALTPQTVPAPLLGQANALVRMGASTGRLVGVGIGGVLVAGLGSGWAMGTNVVVFLLAASAYRMVRSAPAPRREHSRPLADLAEGWREFTARSWVWIVVLQFTVVNAVQSGTSQVLGPVVADRSFGRAGWGFALAALTAGAFAGGVLAARWQPRRALLIGVAAIFADALPMLVLAEAPVLPLLAVTMFLTGVALEQFGVAWDLSLQENIPPDRLARVCSYDILGSLVAIPVGQVAAGPLAEHLGTRPTLLGAACLILASTAFALCSKEIRGLTRTRQTVPVG